MRKKQFNIQVGDAAAITDYGYWKVYRQAVKYFENPDNLKSFKEQNPWAFKEWQKQNQGMEVSQL